MENKTYIAIDLKSFYASVECAQRGLDPLNTNLVVADASRTEKTICLAVSPSLKAYGIPGRPRLFEVIRKVKEINARRLRTAPGGLFADRSFDDRTVRSQPYTALDYIVAPPRMSLYIDYSARIYQIYLKYAAPEDIHIYSIDEVFIDATAYLDLWKLTPRELTMKIILDVLSSTGITATAGIGSNLYLAKVAMDIMAKHISPDENGVRIAELDEMSYRRSLWSHRPLTDFWRVGRGTARKLEELGLMTMGDIARCSLGGPDDYYNEDLLYKLFGVNAELLIDHAWGWEPCEIADIKAYRPETNSLSSGQVLQHPYTNDKAALVVREMAGAMALDLVDKGLVTDQLTLAVGYDTENLKDPERFKKYRGPVTVDGYGRKVPKSAHGSLNLEKPTSSNKLIVKAAGELFRSITDESLLVRRLTLTANRVVAEAELTEGFRQLDLMDAWDGVREQREREARELEKEKNIQKAILSIKKKYGKNAVIKGIDLEDGATAIDRNGQIGGHKS